MDTDATTIILSTLHLFCSDAFNSTERVNATIGEEVKCVANSSQSCSYKWIWFNGSQSVLTNQTFKPMEAGPYRCEATCHIGNTSCIVDAMFVEVYSTQSPEGIHF